MQLVVGGHLQQYDWKLTGTGQVRTDAPNIVENEHVDQSLQAETNVSLAKQAAVSKKQAAAAEDRRGGLGTPS